MQWVRKYTLVVKTSISSGLVYSLNFLMGSVFFALIIFIFLQLWETVSAKSGAIEGYSVNKLIWYYVAAELVMLTRSDVFQNLNEDIPSKHRHPEDRRKHSDQPAQPTQNERALLTTLIARDCGKDRQIHGPCNDHVRRSHDLIRD